ncbi:low-density lipoprotein receptor 1-like isoform X2 [Biomphalaria glabrata]|uniref:Low-density lipoprotein receptor 1-like isoform X2 n=1 Tax=Biomphalaria glabrata TaxID=6526 RepID=A0A9W3AYH4_BIOGL|nr:low-density lipoprotein receptor 1-like isoform X2 [Biomphalaria glabrata]
MERNYGNIPRAALTFLLLTYLCLLIVVDSLLLSSVMSTECLFICSTLQCINLTSVCDGVIDCDNGQDEYCREPGLYLDSSLENYTLPCFRCADGRCISPIPLLYGSHGLPDWFLCDGISHCKDSSDEDDGVCRPHKRPWIEKLLITCVPSDLEFGQNNNIMMWANKQCDGVIDCYNGLDEKKCGLKKSMKFRHRPSTSTSDTVFTQVSTNDRDEMHPAMQCVCLHYKDLPEKVACKTVLTNEVDRNQTIACPRTHLNQS